MARNARAEDVCEHLEAVFGLLTPPFDMRAADQIEFGQRGGRAVGD